MTTWSYRARGFLGVACGLCVAISSVASFAYLSVPHHDSPGTTVEFPESDLARWALLSGLDERLSDWEIAPGAVSEPTETSHETQADLLGSTPLRGGASGGATGDIIEPDVDSPLSEPRMPSDASQVKKRSV